MLVPMICRHNLLPSWPMNVRSSYVLILSCLDSHMKGNLRRQLWLALLSWFILFNKFAKQQPGAALRHPWVMKWQQVMHWALRWFSSTQIKDFGVKCIILDLFSQHEQANWISEKVSTQNFGWHQHLPLACFSTSGSLAHGLTFIKFSFSSIRILPQQPSLNK